MRKKKEQQGMLLGGFKIWQSRASPPAALLVGDLAKIALRIKNSDNL